MDNQPSLPFPNNLLPKDFLLRHPLGKVPADFIETNVASINLDEDIEHPAMFPEELIEPFVKATTGKDDLVLDIFAGSATTGAVDLDLGRRFVRLQSPSSKLCWRAGPEFGVGIPDG